jgi:hypothetical protein
VAEGARLESVFTSDRNAGSNPAFSAICPQMSQRDVALATFSSANIENNTKKEKVWKESYALS